MNTVCSLTFTLRKKDTSLPGEYVLPWTLLMRNLVISKSIKPEEQIAPRCQGKNMIYTHQ